MNERNVTPAVHVLVPALALGLFSALPAHGQRPPGADPVREQIQFQSDQSSAPRSSPRIDIRLWSIAGGQKLSPLKRPFPGAFIVELRAGSVLTVIDGQRTVRRAGEIWSVPAGVELHVETADDMATLQTTAIEKR